MDNHPTIDIITAPSADCPLPVWNCVQYCFRSNDFLIADGVSAGFGILFGTANYPDGITVALGDYVFTTATPGGSDSFSWQGTPNQIAENFAAMLRANYEIGCLFSVDVLFGSLVVMIAREPGFRENWIANFPVAVPPGVLNCVGAETKLLPNYRLVIEVWKCEDGVPTDKISTLAFEPDPGTSEVCLDISRIVSNCVRTTFPGLTGGTAVVLDNQIKAEICLRYGEIYSDDLDSCEAKTRFFEYTSPRTIINSAFQKDDDQKIAPFCWNESFLATRFLTNRPNFAQLCQESFAWFWYCLESFLLELNGINFASYYVFEYTDGTTSETGGDILTQAGAIIVPGGLAQIGGLADPGKTVLRYSVYVVAVSPFFGIIPISSPVIIDVADGGFCCCFEEFYFLSEPGGFDTILFNCLQESDLSYKSKEFCSFEPCGGDILEGGKGEAEAKAFEIYRTTSRFLDNYENLNWFREFLKSPDRRWRKDGKVYKIVFLTDEVELYRKDGFIFVEIEFILSFELNQQKN